MSFNFTDKDLETISKVLNVSASKFEGGWTWKMNNPETGEAVLCTIYNEAQLDSTNKGVLVSVQTRHGYFELHNCNSFLVFEPDEVIFIRGEDEVVSSLIIGKKSTCSMYSNISRQILGSDFSNLDPAVLLSAMQLSLTENVLPEKMS